LKTETTFTFSEEKIDSLRYKSVVIKVGGNALTDDRVKSLITQQIAKLYELGIRPIIIHGGGIEIKQLLDRVGIVSEFIGGHRRTDTESIRYIEMALSGQVNKDLVGRLNAVEIPAVGISGKDADMVKATRRKISKTQNREKEKSIDLGLVGDVDSIDPSLLNTLLQNGYLPVISPVSAGPDGETLNVNADMFAGHIAAAVGAEKYVVLTNVDGLLKNREDSTSLITKMSPEEAKELMGSVIEGGMIPKVESCMAALEGDVASAHIINGTKKDSLLRILLTDEVDGTSMQST
jgi:acetylglutamate kinase